MNNLSYYLSVYINLQRPYQLYVWAILLSVLGSCMAIYNTGLVNSDGTVYLGSAKAYIEGGWSAAAAYHPKPFYASMIALLSQVLSISLLHSAYIINTLLFALLTACFVDVVWLVTRRSPNQVHVVLFSLAFIVLFPRLNEIKDDVYRDVGLWAFSLLAMCFMLRWDESPKKVYGLILWLFSQLMAGLFKNEGYLLLGVLPILLVYRFFSDLFFDKEYSVKRKISLFAFLLLSVFGLFQFLETYGFLNRLGVLYSGLYAKSQSLADVFLNKHSDEHAFSIALIASFWIVLCEFVKSFDLSILLCIFAFCFLGRKYENPPIVLLVYLFVSISIIALFAIERQFLVGRYVTLAVLLASMLMFLLYREKIIFRQKSFMVMCFFFVVQFFDSFISFGYSREYVEEAAHWIDENVASTQTVISNRRGFTYSVDRVLKLRHFSLDDPSANVINTYDYYVFLTKDKQHALDESRYVKIQQFENEKKHKATIYKVVKP